MSESSGGKLAVMRQQAQRAVASAPGRAIGQAAREEIQPVMDRLDAMTSALAEIPQRMEQSAATSATALRDSLAPMVEQVTSLRTSLESLPTLLAQQTDGIVAQLQGEGLTLRSEIDRLKGGLVHLPEALAREVAPIVMMAERLDEVLALQRSSLAALHEESVKSFRVAMEPTAERIDSGLGALTKQVGRTGAALQTMKGLPKEIREAAEEAKRLGAETSAEIRKARGGQWHPVVQVLTTAVLAAALIVGGLTWVGTQGSSRLPLLGGASSKERAWEALYEANPQLRQAMDSYLAASARR